MVLRAEGHGNFDFSELYAPRARGGVIVVMRASGGHLEKKVESQEAEDGIGRPSGEKRRQQSGGAHRFQERCSRAIHYSNSDGDSEAADGAASSRQEGKGRAQEYDDRGNQWECKLFMPLNGEARSVEAGLPQACNVGGELVPAHLVGLQNLATEIAGWLGEFRKRGRLERRVADKVARFKIASPAAGENPSLLRRIPGRASGIHAAANLKSGGVEFENVETAE